MSQQSSIVTTGGDALVEALVVEGVDKIFGLPGIQLDPVFDALYRNGEEISLVTARHEQAVTYMADGYSRRSHRPGVGIVVPGPGFLNSTAGLATAYACGSKVLLIVGQISSDLVGLGRGALHELPDQLGIIQRLSRWSYSIKDPDEVAESVRAAFQYLESNPGPAVLEIPADVLRLPAKDAGKPVEAMAHAETSSLVQQAGFDEIKASLERISKAKNPVVILGGGLRYARSPEIATKFIEHLQLCAVVTDNGKGSVPASHPLVFERSGFESLQKDADLIIGIGTRFVDAEAQALASDSSEVILINTDVSLSERLGLHGAQVLVDWEEYMRIGLSELESVERGDSQANRLSAARRAVSAKEHEAQETIQYLQVIQEVFPQSGTIVADYTQLGYCASFTYPVESQNAFLWPGYQGTLGYSFATGIGAALADSGPVLVIIGDGGFSWTMEELSTVARYRPNLITLIVNDGHYGNVRRIQKSQYGGREIASDLTNPNFVKLAEAFDIDAVTAKSASELRQELENACRASAPQIIELTVPELPSPWGLGYK